ncbi:MAG: hypothetical protein J5699_04160 [Bacteroidales bacterium]|nr:hypothetical protein [Bacteroidales bacterium]
MRKRTFHLVLILLISSLLICSCASTGEKAAKEVVSAAKSGNMEKAHKLLMKYEDSLKGQDLIDFCDELERAGLL